MNNNKGTHQLPRRLTFGSRKGFEACAAYPLSPGRMRDAVMTITGIPESPARPSTALSLPGVDTRLLQAAQSASDETTNARKMTLT